jgi:hypothetical protein
MKLFANPGLNQDRWHRHDNEVRPHSSLGYQPPFQLKSGVA